MEEKELEELAEEMAKATEDFCERCYLDYGDDFDSWEDFEKENCGNCDIVIAYDPRFPEDAIIKNYQFLQRITGMVILSIPISKEELVDNLLGYEELTEKQKQAYTNRRTPWDFRFLEED